MLRPSLRFVLALPASLVVAACGGGDSASPAGAGVGGTSAGKGGAGGASAGGAGGSSASGGSAAVGGASGSGATTGGKAPPDTMKCGTLPPAASGTCDILKGSAVKVVRGRVIGTDHVYEGGEIVLDDKGVIACVGCDCSTTAGYVGATTLTCASGVVSPSLINTHDHITYAQNAPAAHTAKYDHRHEWRKGLNGKPKLTVPAGTAKNETVAWGELRFVLGGAASTVGSGGIAGMIRNLDKADPLQEGLGKPAVTFDTFPLGDSSGTLATTCSYTTYVTTANAMSDTCFFPHIAEGVSDAAHEESLCTDGQAGSLANYDIPQTAEIHAIGLGAADAQYLANGGSSVIWSPRSNIDLYGFTAPVTMYARMGVRLALGTDWSASGSMNLLRELACADTYNKQNLGGFFSDYQLYRMVTEDAAAVTRMDDKLGKLVVGHVGDVTVWAGGTKAPFDAVIRASVADVALVLRGGLVLHGDAALVDALSPDGGAGCEALTDCLATKKVCAARELGKTIAQLTQTLGNAYPLFFCGAPATEPSCVPSRMGQFTGVPAAGDMDGDGIDDASDLCPSVFSAVRPMDAGKQPDADGDGVGDLCDPCPLKANSTDCTPVMGQGPGGMGAGGAGAGGAGAGSSGAGGSSAGAGGAGMAVSATIPMAKAMADGTSVAITGACVTATRMSTKGTTVWVQDAMATENAGLVAYGAMLPMVTAGDLVDVSGTLSTFKGLRELTMPTLTKTGSCPITIAPIVVTADAIATGGASMDKLMSMLVEVDGVSVTTAAAGTSAEFVVTGGLHVSDFVFAYPATDYPLGTSFSAIKGVLDYYTDHSKLDVRSAADLAKQ